MSNAKTMPRPKSKPESDPSKPKDAREIIITFKGSADYHGWLRRLAVHSRQSAATVLDLALIDYAKKVGFPEVAPLRNPPRD